MNIVVFSRFAPLVAFIIGLIFFRRLSKNLKIVFYFVLLGVFTEIFTRIYQEFLMQNTMPIGHFYIPISFLIMALFYLKELGGFINRKIIIGFIVLFEVFCIINSVFIQSLLQFPNIAGSTGAIILLVFSIVLFNKIMVEAKIKKLFAEPLVWINTGVLLYYSANLFFYALFNYSVVRNLEFAKFTVNLFSVFNLLFYLLIAIGFWKAGKQVKRVKPF